MTMRRYNGRPSLIYPRVKRAFDITGALLALVLTAPLIAVVAIAVRLVLGRPVIFRQQRPGLNERLFTCLKFRTMTDRCDEDGQLLSDAERVTRFGLFLRRTSLDELPQFWNILRGNLSFVGPRPLLEQYLPHYTAEERRRHLVTPGLTGWAQIHGRSCVPFDVRLAMDVWYVDHMSFLLDLRILLSTVQVVLSREGIPVSAAACLAPLNAQRSVLCSQNKS